MSPKLPRTAKYGDSYRCARVAGRRKLVRMNTFKYAVVGVLICAGAAASAPGSALAGPLSTRAPNAHNTFALSDDPGGPPPPPPPPAPTPFCTPRGGLFIVGPICDEIGVGPPERTAP
jgi:hypothetical protein